MTDHIGKVSALTVITPIIPEKLSQLEQTLEAVQQNPNGSIAKISTIHYARWVIIDNGRRLLFTSNYDGQFEDYIQDFVREIPDGLDRIWGNCEGYPGSVPIEPFFNYINTHKFPTNTFYAAYPHLTVAEVKHAEKCNDAAKKLIGPMQQFLMDIS